MLALIGDAMGTVVHITIATIGLRFLISIASFVLPWLHVFGGGYILYLAYRSFQEAAVVVEGEQGQLSSNFEALLSGFLAYVSNPKAIVFFAALFPGFIDPNYNVLVQSLVYGVLFILLDGLSIIIYAAITVYLFQSTALSGINHNHLSGFGMLAVEPSR